MILSALWPQNLFKRTAVLAVLTSLIVAGIVVIPKLVASPQQANCEWRPAFEAGLSGLIAKEPPKLVPETAFYDVDDNQITIADYRGTNVIMNFWATWCAPCVAEMGALDRLQEQLVGSNIEVLAINEDRDGKAVATAFFEERGLSHLRILMDRDMKLSRAAEVAVMPTTLLINKNGFEVAAVLGEAEWDSPDIVAYLKQCFSDPETTAAE
ncbi:MAG: TlpA family protein disulfide reductase [Rhodospirillales bacterium]|jgi:thiol-disulfide isomerase/thioredoxin|nr:TlpA family protein disulfide reductase [Rhodospirillales bacterium]MBT4039020.1 TlpA family protein disulfide reductase [Rhodospirillales bacterium]MBT4628050.1 TlpA family protein disulfide reductase [Rhodospirillales bacterium]MBT5352574.1 TlpA family protein disulfide reductase [Rhodospirillales bacterium]MBT5520896.1 TlpA family protein disulfide reductase [Rhodospirillales bacterium]